MGATVENLSAATRKRFSIPDDVKGVVVAQTEEGSKSEAIGLSEGDVIRGMNQEECPDLSSFKTLAKKYPTKNGIVLDVWQRGQSIYLSYMGPEK